MKYDPQIVSEHDRPPGDRCHQDRGESTSFLIAGDGIHAGKHAYVHDAHEEQKRHHHTGESFRCDTPDRLSSDRDRIHVGFLPQRKRNPEVRRDKLVIPAIDDSFTEFILLRHIFEVVGRTECQDLRLLLHLPELTLVIEILREYKDHECVFFLHPVREGKDVEICICPLVCDVESFRKFIQFRVFLPGIRRVDDDDALRISRFFFSDNDHVQETVEKAYESHDKRKAYHHRDPGSLGLHGVVFAKCFPYQGTYRAAHPYPSLWCSE